ncbi:MAG TPA: DUF6786 family protein [Planctomycetota bacterium]|nr:DUF6786 family protein [Planctomycetota bacterium]
MRLAGLLALAAVASGCHTTFLGDQRFLERYTETIVLSDREGQAQVAVCPALQGRVMTSTATGPGGASYGWINYDLVASGATRPQINPYGGEDRFWLGPEGGPYSLFFKKGEPQDLRHWQTPAPIDSMPFQVHERSEEEVSLRAWMVLTNASGTRFELEVRRDIRLLRHSRVWAMLEMPPRDDVRLVAFESRNEVFNRGPKPWSKAEGLTSIWILGMFGATPATTVVLPLRPGAGPAVNDAYFGRVPADRLVVRPHAVFFKGDGQHRSKIGVGPDRARPTLGSWDAQGNVLTLVQYTLPGTGPYVNSLWNLDQDPYAGDVVNSYNDGPPAPGEHGLGAFYELESSSPGLMLAPGKSAVHVHRTIHLEGTRDALDQIARRHLQVGLDDIEQAFAGPPR